MATEALFASTILSPYESSAVGQSSYIYTLVDNYPHIYWLRYHSINRMPTDLLVGLFDF